MPNSDNRKVHLRVMSFHLDPVFEGATDHAPVHPPDLDTHGMFINTPDHLPVGSVMQLQFRLALTDVEIAVEANVRHVVEGFGVGVEFVNLSPEAEHAIERELQAGILNFGSGEPGRMEKRTLLSDLPRRMWNAWIHGEEQARIY